MVLNLISTLLQHTILVILLRFSQGKINILLTLNSLYLVPHKVFYDLTRHRILLINMILRCDMIPMLHYDGSLITISQHLVVLLNRVYIGDVDWMRVPLVLMTAKKLCSHVLQGPMLQILFLNDDLALCQLRDVDLFLWIQTLGLVRLDLLHELSDAALLLCCQAVM